MAAHSNLDPAVSRADLPAREALRQRRGRFAALSLTALRLALAPLLVILVHVGSARWPFAVVLCAGFASDVFDGVIARRTGAVTPALRRFDSVTDTVFYVAVAYAAWYEEPEVIRRLDWAIGIVVAAELFNYVLAYVRFRRLASYHARTARLWGLFLFVSLVLLLGWGYAGLLLPMLVIGMVAQLETLAMTLVLRRWHHDVPGILSALALRARDDAAAGS